MPKGTTHAKATVALAVASGLLAYFHFDQTLVHSAAISGGALAGLVLTPDLDVNVGCISNDIVRRSGGRAAGNLWTLFWRPYSLLMPHRSPLSHMPIVGTAIRLMYLSIIPALLFWYSSGTWAGLNFPDWGWWAVGGLALADTLHFLMDQIM